MKNKGATLDIRRRRGVPTSGSTPSGHKAPGGSAARYPASLFENYKCATEPRDSLGWYVDGFARGSRLSQAWCFDC